MNDAATFVMGESDASCIQVGPTRSCLEVHCLKRSWAFEVTGNVFVSVLSTT